jgi:predicted Zn-ribbon and HTH transcriptional regulator
MAKLQCFKCNFEFDKEQIPLRCPYCAAEETVITFKTAQDFLNETEL